MKVNPTFLLRDPKSTSTSIVMYARWNGKRVVFGTSQVIDPKLWDSQTMRATKDPKKLRSYKKKDPQVWANCDRINSQLNRISDTLTDFFIKAGEKVPTPEAVKTYLIQEIKPEKATTSEVTLNKHITHFIEEISSGRLQTAKGTHYAETTIKAYKSFRLRFTEFQTKKRKVYDFEDIDMDFYEKFTAYLTSIGNKPNSTGKQIKCLKTILRSALDLKLHSNRTFQARKFKVFRLDSEEIYLTEGELSRIASLDLSDNKPLEIARDVFLIGCHSAQRISDYSRFTKKSITKTSQGLRVIDLRQIKTGSRVIIPIKPQLWTLLEKYDFSVPHIFEQKLNERIKEIGKLAGITESVQITEYKQGAKVLKHVPKYTLIQSHTARRTGATLMHLAGISTLDLMKITGHKQVKELMQYIRVSEEETAEKLALHPYFSPLQKVKK